LFNLSFNGITKPYITVLEKIRPPWAAIKRNILTIKGLPGGYLEDTDTQPRVIGAKVLIENKNYFSDLNKLKEDLAAWLITDSAKELIFEDESDRTYFAAVDGTLDLDEIVSIGQGFIYFICPDAYKYGSEKMASFTSAGSFNVEGTVETDPIIEVKLKGNTTYVVVSDGDKLNMVGSPVDVDQSSYSPTTRILESNCNTLVGWTQASGVSLEEVPIGGTLLTDGTWFYANDYGTGSAYHGPAMKTSLASSLQDFQFEAGFRMAHTALGQAGVMMVSLLDINNNQVVRIMATKRYPGINRITLEVRAGNYNNHHIILPEEILNFNNEYEGFIHVRREGTFWRVKVFYMDGVNTRLWYEVTWNDSNGIATVPVTQVQVRVLQSGTSPAAFQRFNDIDVYRVNQPGEFQVPIIGSAGDTIEFDHKTDIIRKNGYDITKEKAFIGEYFSLVPGMNTIIAEPANSIESVKVRWRPKWR
jgi:predicted phage tail component-like protein